MNDFVAKKLGEVMAFTSMGLELIERGGQALAGALGEKTVNQTRSDLESQLENIKTYASETTLTKAEATGGKLRGMAETYIGDQWDNPAELLEWLGFFEGAALVHWQLVSGAAAAHPPGGPDLRLGPLRMGQVSQRRRVRRQRG
jgi:hypothetical protein